MTPKQEILAITELAMDITELKPCRPIHCCSCGASSISVTAFDDESQIDWQSNIYDWDHCEAYLPKLRWLRNELEQMLEAAVAEKREMAA